MLSFYVQFSSCVLSFRLENTIRRRHSNNFFCKRQVLSLAKDLTFPRGIFQEPVKIYTVEMTHRFEIGVLP
jgi:hypothetical protein